MKPDDLILLVAESNKQIFEIEQALGGIGPSLRIRSARRLEEVCCYFRGVGIYQNRTSHRLPALALVDLSSLDGLKIVNWIRKQSKAPNTPIVGFGNIASDEIQVALEAGITAYYPTSGGFLQLAGLLQDLDLPGDESGGKPVRKGLNDP